MTYRNYSLKAFSALLVCAGLVFGCSSCGAKIPNDTVNTYVSALGAGDLKTAQSQVQNGGLPNGYDTISEGMSLYWKSCTISVESVTDYGEKARAILKVTAPNPDTVAGSVRFMAAKDIYELSQTDLENGEFRTQSAVLMTKRLKDVDFAAINKTETEYTIELVLTESGWIIAEGSDISFLIIEYFIA